MAWTDTFTTPSEADGGVLFKDATGTPIVSPIAASQTNKELVPHASARLVWFCNSADSTGVVTIKLGTVGAADSTGAITLGPGDWVNLPCAKMGREASYKTRFFVTTAASTTCSFAFFINSSDGT